VPRQWLGGDRTQDEMLHPCTLHPATWPPAVLTAAPVTVANPL